MAANIVTLEDLNAFGENLLQKIHSAFSQKPTEQRKWLKSHEVLRLLRISPGTLQTLRLNGKLPYIKIVGTMYYEYEDIKQFMDSHKRTNGRLPEVIVEQKENAKAARLSRSKADHKRKYRSGQLHQTLPRIDGSVRGRRPLHVLSHQPLLCTVSLLESQSLQKSNLHN